MINELNKTKKMKKPIFKCSNKDVYNMCIMI